MSKAADSLTLALPSPQIHFQAQRRGTTIGSTAAPDDLGWLCCTLFNMLARNTPVKLRNSTQHFVYWK